MYSPLKNFKTFYAFEIEDNFIYLYTVYFLIHWLTDLQLTINSKNLSKFHLTNINNSVYEVSGKKPVMVRVRVRFRIQGGFSGEIFS